MDYEDTRVLMKLVYVLYRAGLVTADEGAEIQDGYIAMHREITVSRTF